VLTSPVMVVFVYGDDSVLQRHWGTVAASIPPAIIIFLLLFIRLMAVIQSRKQLDDVLIIPTVD